MSRLEFIMPYDDRHDKVFFKFDIRSGDKENESFSLEEAESLRKRIEEIIKENRQYEWKGASVLPDERPGMNGYMIVVERRLR